MQWCAAVGVSVSRVTWNSVPMLIGSVASGLWRCGTVSVSFRSVRGHVVVPSRFIIRVGTTSLLVCARTLAELVGAWQPSFQKITRFSSLFSCVPVLPHAIVILIALFVSLGNFRALFQSPYVAFSVSLALSWSICKNVSFGHNSRRSKSRSACFSMRFCACLRSAQFSIHVGLAMCAANTCASRVGSPANRWCTAMKQTIRDTRSVFCCNSAHGFMVLHVPCAVWIQLLFLFHQRGTRSLCAHADRCEPEGF